LFPFRHPPSTIVSYVNGVEKLGGDNFAEWRDEINLILVMMDKDHSIREPAPVAPVARWIRTTP
jgi:hypothetical protein